MAMSSVGGGGGGEYSMSRQVFTPKVFKKGEPAAGDLADGKAHVWKFSASSSDPLLVHWKSTLWDLSVSIYDSNGERAGWPTVMVDGNNEYGILKVYKPTEFLIVILPSGSKSKYSIELMDLPGRGK